MDIIFLSDNNHDIVGGEQESTKIIVDNIKDNFEVGIIQPGKLSTKITNVRYFDLTEVTRMKMLVKKPMKFLKYIFGIRKIIIQNKPSIVHTQSQVSFFIVSMLITLKLLKKNFILIHTERGLYTKYSELIREIFRYFMTHLDILITTTKFNLSYWEKALTNKKYDIKYKIIENTAGKLFESYDELYEKKEEKITVGFAGRYADWKNWPLAEEISDLVYREIGEDFKVKMAVGCLDSVSIEKTQEMFDRMSTLLGENFKGEINTNLIEMDKFYYDIDIFILTSDYNTESFGRTIIEAMSRKTVILTTNAGGPIEIVNNPNNVLKTSDEFKNKIIYFNNNKLEMSKEKNKNLEDVHNRFSLENNIDKHLKLYKNILN